MEYKVSFAVFNTFRGTKSIEHRDADPETIGRTLRRTFNYLTKASPRRLSCRVLGLPSSTFTLAINTTIILISLSSAASLKTQNHPIAVGTALLLTSFFLAMQV